MLNLLKYIKENPNWENELQEKPYCISIKRKDNYIIFNYNQIDSDLSNQIVKECRGIILEDKTYRVICFPFTKFFNIQEGNAAIINWDTARVQSKIDGSIIKLWFDKEWRVSTNGVIDARNTDLYTIIDERYQTYYDLFMEAVSKNELNFNKLNKNYTYIFELISPFNRIVIPYKEIDIFHTGTRDNLTYQELNVDIGIQKPKEYDLNSPEDVIAMAENLPFDDEGYVVVDNNWNRVKVKSPAYVAVHHLKNNGIVSKSRIVTLIRNNEKDEFLSYFPEYKEYFDDLDEKIITFIKDMDWCIETAKEDKSLDNRKRFAEFAKTTRCPALMFNWLDGRVTSAREWLYSQTDEKVVNWIGDING